MSVRPLLARRWRLLAAGAILGALLGLMSGKGPPLYEASTTVFLTPVFEPSGLSTAAGLHIILKNETNASAVLKELGLNDPTRAVNVQTFLQEALSIEQIPNGYFFRVKVMLPDPQLAADAANALSDRGVELTSRLWRDVLAAKPTRIERELEQSRLPLAAAEERFSRYRRANAIAGSGRTPALDEELGRLQAEVDIKRLAYIETAARYEQARAEFATTTPPLRIVDQAITPRQPVSLSQPLRVALGALAGLIATGCLAVGLESRRLWYGSAASGARR